ERGNNGLLYSKMLKGIWTPPQRIDFGLEKGIGDACFSPDGNKLFFLSFQAPNAGDIERERIWFVERKSSGWSKPKLIDEIIYAHPTHWTFSVATNGNLYFTSEIEGVQGEQDIYVAHFEGGNYLPPISVGNAINTNAKEFGACIAPDESYLIFTRIGKNTKKTDLYISFKNKDRSWTKAINMGTNINSLSHDNCTYVSSDGKYLFFISQRERMNGIYWVDAKIIEELKPKQLK
ncbi:MAG: exo-alpha-sialidase, partial [Bacteroidales bacterium]|nr:exo-alpha-sialidase [Bacteroidales bacterium]